MLVVASVATGEQALASYRSKRVDVTLMDMQLQTMSGVATIEALRQLAPEARIVVLTMYGGDEHIARAMRAGAATYLLKDTISRRLIQTIRQVHAGKHPVSPLVEELPEKQAGRRQLTEREIDVLRLVAEGHRNKEIAAVLHISEETVQAHLRNTFAKLRVHDRTAAITTAIRRGILDFR